MGYKGGGRLQVPWCRQKAAKDELRFTLEKFRQQKGCGSNKNLASTTGEREGWRGVACTARSMVVAVVIGILGRRQVTPRWSDDPVRTHVGGGVFGSGGEYPYPEGNQEAGKEGGAGQVSKYVAIRNIA